MGLTLTCTPPHAHLHPASLTPAPCLAIACLRLDLQPPLRATPTLKQTRTVPSSRPVLEEAKPWLRGRLAPEGPSACSQLSAARVGGGGGGSCLLAEPCTPVRGLRPSRGEAPGGRMSPLPLSFGERWPGRARRPLPAVRAAGPAGGCSFPLRLPSLKASLPWCFINNAHVLTLRNVAKENARLGTSRKRRRNILQGDKVKGLIRPEGKGAHQRHGGLDSIPGPPSHLWAQTLTSPSTWRRGGNSWCRVTSEAASEGTRAAPPRLPLIIPCAHTTEPKT